MFCHQPFQPFLSALANNLIILAVLGFDHDDISLKAKPTRDGPRAPLLDHDAEAGPSEPAVSPAAQSSQNMNVRAAFIHIIGDVVQSIGVIIAGVLIWLHPDDKRWHIADPIATFVFSIIVFFTSTEIIKDIADILMERYPRGIDHESVLSTLQGIVGVEAVHDLHVWSLTNDLAVLTAHVDVRPGVDNAKVLLLAEQALKRIGIDHFTIQIEPSVLHFPDSEGEGHVLGK